MCEGLLKLGTKHSDLSPLNVSFVLLDGHGAINPVDHKTLESQATTALEDGGLLHSSSAKSARNTK